ncbi:MAG: OadG family protein [Treponema sp.]|nr:OadG family protein [Treponema sp.]
MTIGQMFEQSGVLTLLGMGTVFAFLIIMIVCVTLVGKIIQRMGLADEEPAKSKPPTRTTGGDAAVTAAITAAVTEYRSTH